MYILSVDSRVNFWAMQDSAKKYTILTSGQFLLGHRYSQWPKIGTLMSTRGRHPGRKKRTESKPETRKELTGSKPATRRKRTENKPATGRKRTERKHARRKGTSGKQAGRKEEWRFQNSNMVPLRKRRKTSYFRIPKIRLRFCRIQESCCRYPPPGCSDRRISTPRA